MSDRGEYRSIPRVLLDGPDFQRLPERARWVFVALKLNFGPAGVEVWYPAELVARLAAQTGASPAGIQDALMTLEREGWIEREGNIVWIRGQLEHDPHVKLANPKHRTMVQSVTDGLPRLPIVGRFIRTYEAWFRAGGEATGAPSKALGKAIEGVYDSLSVGSQEAIESQRQDKDKDKTISLGSSHDDPAGIPTEYPAEFESVWSIYPKRTGGNSKRETFVAWRARLRSGAPVEVLHAGAERYAAFCEAEGKTGTQYVMQGRTFFGPGDRYLETWEPSGNGKPEMVIRDGWFAS